MLFSIQILIKKILKLGLANACFYANSNQKNIEKFIFASFGKILVLVNVFFYSNSN